MVHYRRDIDGLRALAVLPVMLYHAGIPFFTGGFIGVDVFLVISGFLITSILLKDLSDDKFSLAGFYERRGRRILPALTAVVLFCVAASIYLSPPGTLRSFARSVLWLSFFSSNILFKSEFGYFDAAAHTKPLLHTWSLSVEEQFYVFFPILLFVGWKYARNHIGKALTGLAILSLITSWFGLKHDPSAAFYYIHYRAWELALGCLLAFSLHPAVRFRLPELPPAVREALAGLGLAGILLPVFLYTHQTAFPGLAALPPCLGTFLLLWTNANGQTFVGKFLSTQPAVSVGLLSYSLYLWHWPLLVFVMLHKGEALTSWESACILGASIPISWFSVRFIERPFREKRLLPTRKQVLACSATVLVLTGLVGLAISRPKSPIQAVRSTTASLLEDPRPNGYAFPNTQYWDVAEGGVKLLSIGDLSKPGILVIGDSLADHWVTAMAACAEKNNVTVHLQSVSNCLPLIDTYNPEAEVKYKLPTRARNASFGRIADQVPLKHVVLAGSWKPYLDSETSLYPLFTLRVGNNRASTVAQRQSMIADQLDKTIRFFNARGCKVWIMLPPPEFPYNVPLKLAALVRSQTPVSESFIPRDDALERRRATHEFLATVVSKHKETEAAFLDPFEYFCRDGMCITVEDNHSLYIDNAHLSYHGSLHGSNVFQPIAEELKQAEAESRR